MGILKNDLLKTSGRAYAKGSNRILGSLLNWIDGPKFLPIQIDITNACNLRCAHCYHPDHKNSGAIGLEDWKLILAQYDELLNRLRLQPALIICGGEPLTSPHLYPLLEWANQRWPEVWSILLSNGTLVERLQFERIKNYRIEFQISIDGTTAVDHDSVRGAGSFDKALAGIRILRANGIPVNLLSILSERTAPCIEDFFRLASSIRVDSMNFTRLISSGEARSLVQAGRDLPLKSDGLRRAYLEIIRCSKVYQIPTDTNRPLFQLIDESLGAHHKFGLSGPVVDYKGNLKVSSRSEFIVGNILNEGLANLYLDHSVMKNLRSQAIPSCAGCKFARVCSGDRNVAYSEFGNFFAPDTGCWNNEMRKGKVAHLA